MFTTLNNLRHLDVISYDVVLQRNEHGVFCKCPAWALLNSFVALPVRNNRTSIYTLTSWGVRKVVFFFCIQTSEIETL